VSDTLKLYNLYNESNLNAVRPYFGYECQFRIFFHLKVKMIIFDFCFKFLFSNSLLQWELNLVAMIYCEKYLNLNSLHLLFKFIARKFRRFFLFAKKSKCLGIKLFTSFPNHIPTYSYTSFFRPIGILFNRFTG